MSDVQRPFLRRRDGHHARVTNEELLFDLVYAFAVTQLSHELLEHLTFGGLVETVILWFAVWLGWQYTCWFTNWFDPETPLIRTVLFASMLLALILSSAIPDAYGDRGLIFALAYVGIQVGRCLCRRPARPRSRDGAELPPHARLALGLGRVLDSGRFRAA